MASRTVGHYEVLEQLGAGGMGIVYRARDPRLRREVALKVLRHGTPSSAAARSRLLREARAISALNHPNICTVYDIDEQDDQTFIVMELVSGGPLTLHLRPDGVDSETVARWATQLADGLEHAHQQGVIHRDVKPSNIVVGLDGRVKLVDFGIAAHEPLGEQTTIESATTAETAHGLAGTPSYMAPEVIRGAAADARSDIWSLGVVLYELLSGKRPFPGATPLEVTAAILRDPMPALPRHVPDLTAIVGRCLSKDPATRYQHAGEVRAALEAIQTQIVRRGSAVRPKSILSVAVLPIVNASLDPNLDYLSDGITESIINSLSQLPKLKVMARSTVFRYKERAPDPQTIGRDLGVRAVLTGQLRHIGDRLMISAELVDASDGAQIWGEQYNRTLTDVLEVQQALSAAIVEKLSVRPTSEQKKRLMRQHTASSVRTSTT